MKKENLIGKTLKELKIADDKEAMLLVLGDSEVVVRCDADCCSYTWIEHIEMCDLPAKITSINDIDINSELDTRGGELAFYGCKITTDKGEIVIDYRNESNGYYGGSLSWGDEYFYGGVHGQNVSKQEWKSVTGDI